MGRGEENPCEWCGRPAGHAENVVCNLCSQRALERARESARRTLRVNRGAVRRNHESVAREVDNRAKID